MSLRLRILTAFIFSAGLAAQSEYYNQPAVGYETPENRKDEKKDETKPATPEKTGGIENPKEKAREEIRSNVQNLRAEQKDFYLFQDRFDVLRKKPEFEFLWSFNMLQEYHAWNNGDLRSLKSRTDTDIRFTDDAAATAITRAKMDSLFRLPKERMAIEISWGFDGVWGHDQMQGYSNPGARINRANVQWSFIDNARVQTNLLIGRQYFSIGGLPNDYMQRDILDAFVLEVYLKGIAKGQFLLLDVYSGANNFGGEDSQRWNYDLQFFTRDKDEIIEGLNGDVSTYRWGGVISLAPLFKYNFDPRVYGFIASVRGNGGGSDRSENGQIANFSDNDWSALLGARSSWYVDLGSSFESAMVYVDGAMSAGKDLKRQGEPPADYMTFAGGGGTQLRFRGNKVASFVGAELYWAQGPRYDATGNLTSHGFVSMKGDQIGGLLWRRYYGAHLSSYVDDDGIDASPFDANRKSGITLFSVGGGVRLYQDYAVRLDTWFYVDNGKSDVNFNNIPTNQFKSSSEIAAQKRLGSFLGQEINATFLYDPNPVLQFRLTAAIFIPGPFYNDPIEQVVSFNGPVKGGGADTNFVGMVFGTLVKF